MSDGQDDDEVGYGKPPKHAQFRKGTSGNPRGRPKGARGLRTDLMEINAEKITVIENGRKRKMTRQQATLRAMSAKALKGDVRAATALVNLNLQLIGPDGAQETRKALSEGDAAILDSFIDDQLRLREAAGTGEAGIEPAARGDKDGDG